MGIISVDRADRLFWLGRYTERVYTTIRLYSDSFDELIDGIADNYVDFCKMIDIPDIYGSKEVFEEKYPFDERKIVLDALKERKRGHTVLYEN